MSVAKLFNWFDAVKETKVNSNIGKARWRTEAVERDRLFLTRQGLLKCKHLSDYCSDFRLYRYTL